MNDEARQLLAELNQKYLENALNAEPGSDEEKAAHKLAMESIDRQIKISENDDDYQEHRDKLEAEKDKLEVEKEKLAAEKEKRNSEDESRKVDRITNIALKVGEILVVGVVMPLITFKAKEKFGERVMRWETDGNTFTLEAAKANVKDILKLK